MSNNRNYRYSDVVMCLASQTIAGNFESHLSELSAKRTNWTAEYATDLKVRIKGIIKKHLGIDPKKELRAASSILSELMEPAKRELSFFKAGIDSDFKSDPKKRNEYLKTLGFTKNLEAVQKDDQEALIELLFAFGKNMTDPLRNKFISKGTTPESIDLIIGYAEEIDDANVDQERLKKTTKKITKEAIIVFNGLYDEMIGICMLAANFYNYDPLKKEQFTFSKIVDAMNSSGRQSEDPPE